jgi:hypothetical protein
VALCFFEHSPGLSASAAASSFYIQNPGVFNRPRCARLQPPVVIAQAAPTDFHLGKFAIMWFKIFARL